MAEILDGPVLAGGPVTAADFGSGTGGLLVFVLLGVVSIGLFVAMSGSLRRMRANVEAGRFADGAGADRAGADAAETDGDGPDHDRPDHARTDGGAGSGDQPQSAGNVPGQGRNPDVG